MVRIWQLVFGNDTPKRSKSWRVQHRILRHRMSVKENKCQRRSKNRPDGGAKVGHFGVGMTGSQSAGGQSAALFT